MKPLVRNWTSSLYVLCMICFIFPLISCVYNQDPVKVDKHLAPDTVSFKSTSMSESTFAGPLNLTGRIKRPAGDGPFPAVVLMHGCAGIQPVRDDLWAERLSSWGYVTLQVDSLGPRGISTFCMDSLSDYRDIINKRAIDAYDAKRYLANLPFVDRNRIAIMGWSHGGGAVIDALYRKEENPFRTAIVFYPSCLDTLTGLNAPLLIMIGDADDWTPAKDCVLMMPKEKTSPEVALKIYPGAYHAFDRSDANHYMQGYYGTHFLKYQPEADADSIIQVRAFFEKYLK